MPIAQRNAEVIWEGSLAKGAGVLSTGSGVFARSPVTWAARTEQPDGKTSPEELIAAAHASCFAMALSLVLGEAKTPAERLAVTAVCTLDEVQGAPRITSVELTVRAQGEALDRSSFERHVAAADSLCPVSNALRAGVQISVQGHLGEVAA